MQKEFTTNSAKQTQKLGQMLAQELSGGIVICLDGELGAGKTTFTQGFLKGLGISGPYTSPTFVVMKEYKVENSKSKCQISNKFKISNFKFQNIYHIDAYRVGAEDISALGWEEMIRNKNNIIIVEWAERICDIIPKDALRIEFEWATENERKIVFKISN